MFFAAVAETRGALEPHVDAFKKCFKGGAGKASGQTHSRGCRLDLL